MMNAGHDTAAISLRNALFFLLRNHKCLAKLREEVDEVLEGNEVIALYSKVKTLLYLRVYIDKRFPSSNAYRRK
jgi:cytochrome P450